MKFGDIVGTTHASELRAVALCRADDRRFLRETWLVMILEDDPRTTIHGVDGRWETGKIVSISPDMAGFWLIEEAQ